MQNGQPPGVRCACLRSTVAVDVFVRGSADTSNLFELNYTPALLHDAGLRLC